MDNCSLYFKGNEWFFFGFAEVLSRQKLSLQIPINIGSSNCLYTIRQSKIIFWVWKFADLVFASLQTAHLCTTDRPEVSICKKQARVCAWQALTGDLTGRTYWAGIAWLASNESRCKNHAGLKGIYKLLYREINTWNMQVYQAL